jgi:hypothetical protein
VNKMPSVSTTKGASMEDDPMDPFTGLLTAATSLHEMYESLVKAGFNEAQALNLVGQMLRGMVG